MDTAEEEDSVFINMASISPVSGNADSPPVDDESWKSEDELLSPMTSEEAMLFHNQMTVVPPRCFTDKVDAKKVPDNLGIANLYDWETGKPTEFPQNYGQSSDVIVERDTRD